MATYPFLGLALSWALGATAYATPQNSNAPMHLDAACQDLSACVRVRTLRGVACDTDESINLHVTNRCSEAVALAVCLQETAGNWDCISQPHLAVGATDKKAFESCHATGARLVLATRESDLAQHACFVGHAMRAARSAAGRAAHLSEPSAVVVPVGGVCARVRACCRALESLPGMESMAQACEALDQIDPIGGSAVCQQVLSVMRQSGAREAGLPNICR